MILEAVPAVVLLFFQKEKARKTLLCQPLGQVCRCLLRIGRIWRMDVGAPGGLHWDTEYWLVHAACVIKLRGGCILVGCAKCLHSGYTVVIHLGRDIVCVVSPTQKPNAPESQRGGMQCRRSVQHRARMDCQPDNIQAQTSSTA